MTTIPALLSILPIVVAVGIHAFAEERRWFARTLSHRDKLSVREWYEAHYAHTDIDFESVAFTLRFLRRVLGYDATLLRPTDSLAQMFDDLDFADVATRLVRELKLRAHDSCPMPAVADLVSFVHRATRQHA